jgi:tetratricopeptide (TPR) repeat protein
LWWYGYFEAAHVLLEQAISSEPEEADGYFWQGMIYVSRAQYPAAVAAIEKALAAGMPPILLRPLHWFEQENPAFYELHAAPLLTRYNVL